MLMVKSVRYIKLAKICSNNNDDETAIKTSVSYLWLSQGDYNFLVQNHIISILTISWHRKDFMPYLITQRTHS